MVVADDSGLSAAGVGGSVSTNAVLGNVSLP